MPGQRNLSIATFVASYGALTQNLVVATCYATLGTDAVVHAVNEGCGARVAEQLRVMLAMLPSDVVWPFAAGAVTALVCNRKAAEGRSS